MASTIISPKPKGIELKVPVKQDIGIDYVRPEEDIIPPPQGRHEDILPQINPVSEPDNGPSCIICIQSIPPCDCKSPTDCVFVPQTCHRCAHYVCRNDIDRSDDRVDGVVREELCVDCRKNVPQCKCASGSTCKIEPRNCKHCAKAVCILDPIQTANTIGISNQLSTVEDNDLEIEYDSHIDDSQ